MVQIQNEYWGHTEEKLNRNFTKVGFNALGELRYKSQGVELLYSHIMTFPFLDVLDMLSRNIRALFCKTSFFIS